MPAIRKDQYIAMRDLMEQGLDDKAIAEALMAPANIIASYRTADAVSHPKPARKSRRKK